MELRMSDGQDRRRYERVSLIKSVQYVQDEDVYFGNIEDISEGGLRLRAIEPPPVAAMIRLFVALPDIFSGRQRMRMLEGRVTWQDAHTAGVSFGSSSKQHAAPLAHLLRKSHAAKSQRRSSPVRPFGPRN